MWFTWQHRIAYKRLCLDATDHSSLRVLCLAVGTMMCAHARRLPGHSVTHSASMQCVECIGWCCARTLLCRHVIAPCTCTWHIRIWSYSCWVSSACGSALFFSSSCVRHSTEPFFMAAFARCCKLALTPDAAAGSHVPCTTVRRMLVNFGAGAMPSN